MVSSYVLAISVIREQYQLFVAKVVNCVKLCYAFAHDSAAIRNGSARYQSSDWHDALEKGWSRIELYLPCQEWTLLNLKTYP